MRYAELIGDHWRISINVTLGVNYLQLQYFVIMSYDVYIENNLFHYKICNDGLEKDLNRINKHICSTNFWNFQESMIYAVIMKKKYQRKEVSILLNFDLIKTAYATKSCKLTTVSLTVIPQ